MEDIIIHCPTKDEWVKVQEELFKRGIYWCYGDKEIFKSWGDYEKESCLRVEYNRIYSYCNKEYYQKHYSHIKIITAKEFLTPSSEQNKPAENKMSIIDNIKLARKSEPENSLVQAGLMNMDETLTAEGESVLKDILIQEFKEKMKTEYADILKLEN